MEDNKTVSATENTQIEQIDMDLDSLDFLGTPGAENVMLPEEQKPNVFSKPSVDLSFIDKDSDEEGSGSKEKIEIDDVINEVDPDADFRKKEQETPETKKAGRPKVEKNGMAEVVNKLIESGKIVPFDDETLKKHFNDNIIICEPFYEGSTNYFVTKALEGVSYKLTNIGVPREFILSYGKKPQIDKLLGLDVDSLKDKFNKLI